MSKKKQTEPNISSERAVEQAWNVFFNVDPVRGAKVADRLGQQLIPHLLRQVNNSGLDGPVTPETVLPIVQDAADAAVNTKGKNHGAG